MPTLICRGQFGSRCADVPMMPRTHKPIGSLTEQERNAARYARRSKAIARLYNWNWRRARHVYLIEHPLCCYCQREDRLRPASVVDHITPHRGDDALFWNPDNWQPLCAPCHDSAKQREEKRAR